MMGFMSYFGGRRDPKQSARDAIVTLRQQLQMIEKKEEYLQKKIDTELKAARANAVTNKAGALFRTKRHFEQWNGAAVSARASNTVLTCT